MDIRRWKRSDRKQGRSPDGTETGKNHRYCHCKGGGDAVSCDVYVAKGKPSSGSEPAAKRTVLAYVVADNSLAALAKSDLEEMKRGMASVVSDLMHLLVYVDMGGGARLIEISSQNGVGVEKTIKTYPDRNSTGIAETLEVLVMSLPMNSISRKVTD